MPHKRKRSIIDIIKKRSKLWPVLGLIGPRQCGKSTFLRDLLPDEMNLEYFTMDSKTFRSYAERSPEAFSEPVLNKIKVIDEVQKVPDLFDAVKLHVDQDRRPGMYILSGSTEFSQYTGIRESLTGRVGIIHLYPFSLSEIHQKLFSQYYLKKGSYKAQLKLNEFEKKLRFGGMPGLFYLHNLEEYRAATRQWVETTCFRDLGVVLKKNFDGELALNILMEVAKCNEPTVAEVASILKKDARVVKRYLEAFTRILVLKKVSPHDVSVGKDHYIIIDSGIAMFLGANRETALRSHCLIEALSLFESVGRVPDFVSYYRSEKNSYLPLIFEWKTEKKETMVLQLSLSETPSRLELGSIDSFHRRYQEKKQKENSLRIIFANLTSTSYTEDGIEFHPLR